MPCSFFIGSIVLTFFAYSASQNLTSPSEQSLGSVEFMQVQLPDFFEGTDTVPAVGEKWFKKGLQCVAKGDTAQAKVCSKKPC